MIERRVVAASFMATWLIAAQGFSDCIRAVDEKGLVTSVDTSRYSPCAITTFRHPVLHEGLVCRRVPPPECLRPSPPPDADCRRWLWVMATAPVRQLAKPRKTVCGLVCGKWERAPSGECSCVADSRTPGRCPDGVSAALLDDSWPGAGDGWVPSGRMPPLAACLATLAPPPGACEPATAAVIFQDGFESGSTKLWRGGERT